MRQSDALRIINKCKRLYPELDFTNITIMDNNNYEYKFSAESSGIYTFADKGIYIRIPEMTYERPTTEDHFGYYWITQQYASLMKTMIHEAIHRKVHHDYGNSVIGHGIEFQRECLYFGLDPIRESSHDKRVTERLYPMDETDYKKYRYDNGDKEEAYGETDAEWKMWDKHEATYDRKCPTYKDCERHVGDMTMCKPTIPEQAVIDARIAKHKADAALRKAKRDQAEANVKEKLGMDFSGFLDDYLHNMSQDMRKEFIEGKMDVFPHVHEEWNKLLDIEHELLYGKPLRKPIKKLFEDAA